MGADPAFWARLLLEQAGIAGHLPTDLDALVAWCPVHLDETDLSGSLGLYLPYNGRHGILIAAGQPHTQRRFTVAHELGHFALASKGERAPSTCLQEHMLGALPDKPRERQANEFAAELLMPRRAVAEDVRARDLSFELVKRLASSFRYDVSITSCALRVVEVTREKCALICYENCRLKWAIRSQAFDYALPPKGTPPKLESLTLAAAQGETACDAIAPVSATTWVDPRSTTEEVVESVFAIPSQKQVLALVTVYEAG